MYTFTHESQHFSQIQKTYLFMLTQDVSKIPINLKNAFKNVSDYIRGIRGNGFLKEILA